ncbi:MAG TPA: SDR family oxidoreductase [Steroidobacteraceae bacterium]|jgi:NAD(P)-dependent dehydrogenase (short-subunit alcohol dehydrogenase family)|nr:SDR family oxidoreductase [Steroidobacteraceae bacterium]
MSQKVLVTAGAAGIGLAIARAFAAMGAKVFVADIDAAALTRLGKESPDIHCGVCDLSKRSEIERMVPEAIARLGGLDVLVNNAGIGGPTSPVADLDPEAWEAVMQVNLSCTFNVTRLAIPHLKKSNSASIIVMSSAAGRFGYANRSAYSTSKWGLIGFTKTLALELGAYGIRANAILPGAVAGPRMEKVLEGRAKLSGRSLEEERMAGLAMQSIKTVVEPTDVAALAVFLASDAGRTISGQMLPIDNNTIA